MRPEVASLLPFTQNRQDALNRWRRGISFLGNEGYSILNRTYAKSLGALASSPASIRPKAGAFKKPARTPALPGTGNDTSQF